MDLRSIVNTTNAAPEAKPLQSSSPISQRHSQPHNFPAPPPAGPPSIGRYPSQQGTPQYAPPQEQRSPSGSAGFHSKGATPLQTPSHAAPGQYPFPQHPSQSPVAHPGQQYSPYAAHPAGTPGGRPMSHGSQQQQQPPTPNQMHQGGVPPGFQQYSSSHSPTPPSQHAQTPHSVRQSPLATFAHPPQPQPVQQYPYQQSQPSTPLGPPPLQYQRTSGHGSHPEIFSPQHQRHFSSASNGVVAGSPAQHHPSVGNLIESPNAYNRPSPQTRRTSDYLSQGDRDRSLSVSPKTKVVPRLPSHGSRASSLNDNYSARASMQPQESQGHVQSPVAGRQMGVAQSSFAHSASDVSQLASRSSQLSQSDFPVQPAPQTPLFSNLAANQKMGMNNLLTPAREQQQQQQQQYQEVNEGMARKQSIDPFAAPVRTRAQSTEEHMDLKQEHPSHALLQQPVQPSSTVPHSASTNSLKRGPDDELTSEPPMKREKKRKYAQRPIWAMLSRTNPNYDGTNGNNGLVGKPPQRQQQRQQQQQHQQPQHQNSQRQQQQQQQQHRPPPQSAPASQPRQQMPNGSGHSNGAANNSEPALDMDLAHARSILGPWEKTFKWNTPVPSLLKVIQDWLWKHLKQHSDVGNDPRTGTIEIEAKIGTLIRSGEHDRAPSQYVNMGVIHENFNKQYRFESRMEEVSSATSRCLCSIHITDNYPARTQSHEQFPQRRHTGFSSPRPYPHQLRTSLPNRHLRHPLPARLPLPPRVRAKTSSRQRAPSPHFQK